MNTALLVLGVWFGLSLLALAGLLGFSLVSEWRRDREERRAWELELGRRLTRGERAALHIFNGRT